MKSNQISQLLVALILGACSVSSASAQRAVAKQEAAMTATKEAVAPGVGLTSKSGAPLANSTQEQFAIGESDTLQITIWKQPELSTSATVRPDGSISLPLIDEIKVAGLTTTQAQTAIEQSYKKFITDPNVTVTVAEIRSRKAFITGEVPRPGSYSLLTPTTVLQLIAQAGGFTQFSKRNKIFVLRNENGRQARLNFNFSSVIKGDTAHQNIILKPGDTVVVP